MVSPLIEWLGYILVFLVAHVNVALHLTFIAKHVEIYPVLVIQPPDVFSTDLTEIFTGQLLTWHPSPSPRSSMHPVASVSSCVSLLCLVDGRE